MEKETDKMVEQPEGMKFDGKGQFEMNEQQAENQKNVKPEKESSPTISSNFSDPIGSALGKFKDATSLLSAYEKLEAEFTRKSQRLSEFEKIAKNQPETGENEKSLGVKVDEKKITSESVLTNFSENSNQSAQEKEDKGSEKAEPKERYRQKDWRSEVKKFFAENPDTKDLSSRMGEILLESPEIASSKNALSIALKLAKAENLRKPAELVEDEGFLNSHIFTNEKIKKQIVDEYIKNLNIPKAPKTISSGGIAPLAPTPKYSSFNEAGSILLKSLLQKG